MNPDNQNLADKVAELERRLAEVEKRLSMPPAASAAVAVEKSPPVSPARLADLRKLGGKDGLELLDAVIGLFLSSTTPLLAALHEATAKRNANDLRSAAHALKSTSGNLGAREMMKLCANLEKIAEIAAFSEAGKVLDALDGEFQRVHAALEALRKEGKSETATAQSGPETASARPQDGKTASKKAVICDDDKTLLHIVRHILEKQGFSVFAAVNGEEGLALIRAHEPHLILLDLDMPVKDGLSVLGDLQSEGRTPGYIMVLTHHESQDKHREVKALGAKEALIKPFDPAGFAEKIEGLVREGKI